MSNPFRRSSIKHHHAGVANPGREAISDLYPLSLDTADFEGRSRSSTQTKHVRIASPPAIPISPETAISYPPSPLFTRIATADPSPVGLREAAPLRSTSAANLFNVESVVEDGVPAEQAAPGNAGLDVDIPLAELALSDGPVPDRVRNTLDQFASRPIPATPLELADASVGPSLAPSTRHTIDVDTFTRLLLTGDKSSSSKAPPPRLVGAAPGILASESSSSTDTASLSRQSLFEPLPAIPAESPRTSHELDRDEGNNDDEEDRSLVSMEIQEGKRRPPPPKPRHGKLIKQGQAGQSSAGREHVPSVDGKGSDAEFRRPDRADLNKPLPMAPLETSFSAAQIERVDAEVTPSPVKRPPTPPLARRKSKMASDRPAIFRANSSRQSINLEEVSLSSSSSQPLPTKAPAPPPPRRSNTISDRRPSSDLPPTPEQHEAESVPTTRSASNPQVSTPPLPPPRRSRGASRSSVDSQRPALSQIMNKDGARRDSSSSSRNVSGVSTSKDILADLAELQREVDAMRGASGKP